MRYCGIKNLGALTILAINLIPLSIFLRKIMIIKFL